MAGWGKRAASRIDRTQFEQDELLKSLGTQFNVDFSGYDQWQRKTKVLRPMPKHASGKEDGVAFLVGQMKSECEHGGTYRDKREAARLEQLHKECSERIKTLELRLETRRKTLLEYQRRQKELLEDNIGLKSIIEEQEQTSNQKVKSFLRRYEKYRGGMTTLSANFEKELKTAKEDLKHTRTTLILGLADVERQVAEVDMNLQQQQQQLQTLNSYKDKEYPVKAMNISNLQKDIENLKISNQGEQDELEHIISTEMGKYNKHCILLSNHITHSITEEAVAMMHPSLKDMALQNLVMQKEMEFHVREQQAVQADISNLQEEIHQKLHDPSTNPRLQIFPEFYPELTKCTPDMDVILDIPTQEWLPI